MADQWKRQGDDQVKGGADEEQIRGTSGDEEDFEDAEDMDEEDAEDEERSTF